MSASCDAVAYVCPFASCVRGRFTNRPYGGEAGLVSRDATMQCPIALRICVIPVGAFRETPARRSPGRLAWCCALRRCMHAHLRRGDVGGSRTAPTEMLARLVLRGATVYVYRFAPCVHGRFVKRPRARRISIRQRLSACFYVLYDGVYTVWRRA